MSQGIEQMSQIPGLSQGYGMDQPPQGELNVGRDVLAELMAEKNSLDHAYVHCSRLLDAGEQPRGSEGGGASPGNQTFRESGSRD